MKTLLLMRHAKSSWKHSDLADHERPLNKRGKKDSVFMGAVLKEKELLPQKILASSAVRIRETVEGLVKESGYNGEIEYFDTLYLADQDAFLQTLSGLPDALERVMVMGHNPGLEGLLQVLSGRIESMPTGAVAYLSLPVQQWSEINNGTEGELVELLQPRELREKEEEEEKHKKKDKKEEKEEKKEDKKKEKKHVEIEAKKEEDKQEAKTGKKQDKKAEKKESGKDKKEEKKK